MATREFEVVILGASGFTGRLVAEYLLKQYGLKKDLKWAIAGRNESKLQSIRKELGNEEIPLIVADSLDKEAVYSLTSRTKVLCTTVGPYAKFGDLAVEACVANGTHYCDLSGEVQWIRKMIDTHYEAARAAKVKITNCCGFDSVPSDMGVYFLQQEAKKKFGAYCSHIKMGLKAASGGMSGGTYASLSNVMEEVQKDPSLGKVLGNPYGLNPQGEMNGPDRKDLRAVKYDDDFKSWKSPFIMAAINTKIVRRSHALAGYPFGKDFRYDEFTLTGDGFGGRMKGFGSVIPLAIMGAAKPGSFLKKIVDNRLPKPGEGPNKEQRENGFFNFRIIGKMEDGQTIVGKVTGDRDPGYGSTSKMLGEAAVCLAKDQLPDTYGVITPSISMGDAFLKRLNENSGLGFQLL
ncbi:MAG: saccharopine dehydrogenase NADP-binding domain-containing protein [Bacteroidota bacterium]